MPGTGDFRSFHQGKCPEAIASNVDIASDTETLRLRAPVVV